MFEFVRCSKNDVRVRSMFDKMVFDTSLLFVSHSVSVLSGHVSLSLVRSHCVSLCLILSLHVSLCLVNFMSHKVLSNYLCLSVSHNVSLCLIMPHCVSSCLIVSNFSSSLSPVSCLVMACPNMSVSCLKKSCLV